MNEEKRIVVYGRRNEKEWVQCETSDPESLFFDYGFTHKAIVTNIEVIQLPSRVDKALSLLQSIQHTANDDSVKNRLPWISELSKRAISLLEDENAEQNK